MKTKKTLFLLILFTVSFIGFSQEYDTSNYYRLYKDGTSIERPVVYIFNKPTANTSKIKDSEGLTFYIGDHEFNHNFQKHRAYNLTHAQYKNLNFTKVDRLSYLEHEEYLKAIKDFSDKTKFKPLPPITHFILNVIIISKEEQHIMAYETDWKSAQF